jgi:hypothetical protein
VCGIRECTFVDVHPISYDNDVMHYEGEDRRENRFTTLYSNTLDNGGIELEREANFDKSFKKGRKIIADCCFVLKLNQNIIDVATARFLTILRIMNQEAREERGGEEEEASEERRRDRREKHKNILSIKNMAGYSIYSACFEKENYFEEFNISKVLGLSLRDWKELIKEMNIVLKFKIDFVPVMKPKHVIIRVCRKRKIRHEEERAMVEMCDRIVKAAELDVRINTIAAIAFWKVCEYSQLYKDKVVLNEICKNHDKMQEENMRTSDIQKCFDVTPENVRKVFKESIAPQFLQRYLPNWNGRIALKDTAHDDDN